MKKIVQNNLNFL